MRDSILTFPPRALVLIALVTGVGAVALAGCGSAASPDEIQLAADGTEAMTSSQQSTGLANVIFNSVAHADPIAAAGDVVEPPKLLWPMACATRARDASDPHVAHITFHDCTGPFGLVHLDGEEIVTFSADAGGALHAVIAGVNLTADGSPIAYAATADIAILGTKRGVQWQGSWKRVDAAGATVDHTSDLNIDVDTIAGCRTANGTAKTLIGAREVDTTISDYEACLNADGEEACPSGTVTHTGRLTGKSVTIEFDSTATAQVTGPFGHSFDVTLVCPAADTPYGM